MINHQSSWSWGILGTGGIALRVARCLNGVSFGRFAGAASQSRFYLDSFREAFPEIPLETSYEALLERDNIDAVYITTIHPSHKEWTLKALEAGKHVLCEKPLAMNRADAADMIACARTHGRFLMEAFMYRCHPFTEKLRQIVHSGIIGKVQFIRAQFSFSKTLPSDGRLIVNLLGGGAILDLGGYPVSFARMVAGIASAKPFADPICIKAIGHLHPEQKTDLLTTAVMNFPGEILAELTCGINLDLPDEGFIGGSQGTIVVQDPWYCRVDRATITVREAGGKISMQHVCEAEFDLYTYEFEQVFRHLVDKESPCMSWNDTLGNVMVQRECPFSG